ncbi:MAG: magnesium/cobalt transporter CorA [Kiloniellaceae bacterium]
MLSTLPETRRQPRLGPRMGKEGIRMKRRRHRTYHRSPPGASPGTLTIDPDAPRPEVQLISYGPDDLSERKLAAIEELPPMPSGHAVRWLNVSGLGDPATIQKIGEMFGLHPLALADIANVSQRPKVEAYEKHLFIVTRMPLNPAREDDGGGHPASPPASDSGAAPWAEHAGRLVTEQVAICIGKDFVITFQEQPGDVFEPVRARLRAASGRIRTRGTDYLAYALLDAAIDSFFPLLEVYGERVEDLEQGVVEQPELGYIADIHDLKRDLLTARRSVWPQREMLNALIRDETSFIADETKLYLRDCYDHTIQLIDMIETYREIASGLVDIQLSSVSNRMNEVMKVLTVIATIFIPLTFFAGVYGMNFDPEASPWNMPELAWRYGYPASLLFMVLIAAGLLLWFRHKGWLGGAQPRRRR